MTVSDSRGDLSEIVFNAITLQRSQITETHGRIEDRLLRARTKAVSAVRIRHLPNEIVGLRGVLVTAEHFTDQRPDFSFRKSKGGRRHRNAAQIL